MTAQRAPTDAGLVELERQVAELHQEAQAIDGTDPANEPALAAVDKRRYEAERQIAETSAQSLVGVAVKLRLAAHWIKADGSGEIEEPCALSALETVERLLKEQGNDAEVFEAHKEWKRLEKAAEKTDSKVDWQAALAAERRFLETPARTLAGVLSKLRVGCLPEHYAVEYQAEDGTVIAPPAVLAALADLERMAGGAA